jgi:hypothetical protein
MITVGAFEGTESTGDYLCTAGEGGVSIPQIWKFEMTNLLCVAERRQKRVDFETEGRLESLAELIVREDGFGIEELWD